MEKIPFSIENAKITDYFKISKSTKDHHNEKHQSTSQKITNEQIIVTPRDRLLANYRHMINIEIIDQQYKPRHYKGSYTLYNPRKGNSFYLFDEFNSTLRTNNKFLKEGEKIKVNFISDKKYPNINFLTSKFLHAFFLNQKVIPSRIKNKY